MKTTVQNSRLSATLHRNEFIEKVTALTCNETLRNLIYDTGTRYFQPLSRGKRSTEILVMNSWRDLRYL